MFSNQRVSPFPAPQRKKALCAKEDLQQSVDVFSTKRGLASFPQTQRANNKLERENKGMHIHHLETAIQLKQSCAKNPKITTILQIIPKGIQAREIQSESKAEVGRWHNAPWTAENRRDHAGWTPMQTFTWNAPANSSVAWNNPSQSMNLPRAPPNLSKSYFSRQCTMRSILFLLVASAILITLLMFRSQFQPRPFDGSLGARGGAPESNPGLPLPVIDVLKSVTPTFYFGASIDWHLNDPQHFDSDINRTVHIHDATFFMGETLIETGTVTSVGINHQVADVFNWTASLISGTGAIMGMTIIPVVPFKSITNDTVRSLAIKCLQINRAGVPILLRFAPQMNSGVYTYGFDPVSFVALFREVTLAVRNLTNDTALIWAPISSSLIPAESYPGLTGNLTFNRLKALDTNNDGIINADDDPYSPYWPGDSFVDWIGFTVYPLVKFSNSSSNFTGVPISTDYPFVSALPAINSSPMDGNLTKTLTFENRVGTSGGFEAQLSTFYDRFSRSKNLPMVIYGTSAPYYTFSPSTSGSNGFKIVDADSEVDIKLGWFSQLFNQTLLGEFALVRSIVVQDLSVNICQTSIFQTRAYNYRNITWNLLSTGTGFDAGVVASFSISMQRDVFDMFRRLVVSVSVGAAFMAPQFSNRTTL